MRKGSNGKTISPNFDQKRLVTYLNRWFFDKVRTIEMVNPIYKILITKRIN